MKLLENRFPLLSTTDAFAFYLPSNHRCTSSPRHYRFNAGEEQKKIIHSTPGIEATSQTKSNKF